MLFRVTQRMAAVCVAVATFCLAPAHFARAVAPTPDELALARRFVAAKFGAPDASAPRQPGLIVHVNNNAIERNARNKKPLRIADTEYTRGLYCHAVSKVVVRLPGPGKKFSAIAGLDNNEQTRAGKGSVIFSVNVADREAFRSDVMCKETAGVPIEIDLGGASELALEVGDAGDGIGWDQADWAEARTELADGSTVWLGDLPILAACDALFTPDPPFSFTYAGKSSAELLGNWQGKREAHKLDDRRTQHTVLYTDPETGLQLRCEAVEYRDFPTVEWTLYFKNTGTADTPILQSIRALDVGWQRHDRTDLLLHHNVGSPADGTDYSPLETVLDAGSTTRISAAGGRPTNSDLSYFNLQRGDSGLIVVVGWPGQWAAEFVRNLDCGLRIRAGQELTHFKLHPGEEVRTPLVVLQFWQGGDWIRAQNVWRRWMMAHGMPKPGGKLPPPQFVASSSRAYEEMIGANEANQIMHIDRYLEEGLRLDYWWMDAGWYIQEKGWPQVGTWEVDPKRFPRGFKPISDHAHQKGIKILVWFEPERVAAGTWLAENHPEWIHGGNRGGLLDLGNPEARQWLTDHVDKLLTEQGIDLYRQDFNIDPLGHWRAADAEDRQGITEIRHVTGFLAYWDELRRRHPNLLIDSCASGGRRNDLETMRRSVPLWRSDYAFEPVGHQGMTYGISLWLPYHGTGTVACANAGYYGGGLTPVEPYAFWSNAAPSLGSGIDIRVKEIDYAALRRLVAHWREISPCYYGDFYPLTRFSRENDAWIAWQFDLPEQGKGVVQVFRRAESIHTDAQLKLRGLDPEARFVLRELDDRENGEKMEIPGRELVEQGLPVSIEARPGVAVIAYERAQ
ncbi:MAG TPA: alpha-galactosidase [Thermoguttaceae bacterium]|nr:alpha-galactosidase [Thermoguttaceae bacterium]